MVWRSESGELAGTLLRRRIVRTYDQGGQSMVVPAVARAIKPGCKADCAVVLEGRQGAGKSLILRTSAGEEWFFDGLRDMHGKDASAGLRGK